ncbi:MAG: 2-hydroxychromene-2-carboxylate isomerase [Tateyamaria sp.]|uniref:2-hydroxychromene-2-carboxylate isomerase n=1 Tax=Tateyamaria sp. TaxID=1929288 RepID=UPI0032A0DCA3
MNEITYYYSVHSAFAYLGSVRVMEMCATHGLTLVHRPIPLSPVVEAQGSLPFRARTQAHVDYFFGREIERWAVMRNVPMMSARPTHHDADYTLASGMILALGDRGTQVDEMAHALLQAHWCDDLDLSDATALAVLARSLGHDSIKLLDAAQSASVKEQYQNNAKEALAADVFGSPTYVLNGESYYGQDRLEMVEHAITTPFAATQWSNPPVD